VVLACTVAYLATLVRAQAPLNPPTQPGEDRIIQDFQARVSHYVEQRRKLAGNSPKPTTSSEKLDTAQQELARKSQVTRSQSERGDIFSPEIAAYLRRQIAATLAGPQGRRIRSSLHRAEPIQDVPLHVNQVYPQKLPLQSTPPSLLLNLPPLPKELQYRIVGRNLVLLDVTPKLIVDFVPSAIPSDKD